MPFDDDATPTKPELPSMTLEKHEHGNGGHRDTREESGPKGSETDSESLVRGLLEMHGMLHAIAVKVDLIDGRTDRMRGDIDILMQRGKQDALHRASVPPMRGRLESVSDLDAEITQNGTHIFRGTHEQMERLIDARAEARYLDLQKRQSLENAAAPVMFLKGNAAKFALACGVALAGGLGATIWAFIHQYFQR